MFLHKVRYCSDDVAMKRLKYIMSDIDDTLVDRYINRDGQYTLFYNTRAGVTLLLFKEKDSRNWKALFRTNYLESIYLYCLLAARVICKNVSIVVDDSDIKSTTSDVELLKEAGFKLKLLSSNRFAAISKGDDDVLFLEKDYGCFIIEQDNRVPISINRKK